MIRWHRAYEPRFGFRYWFAEVDGVRIAEAAMTSHTGTEDYPWDWHYTDEGEAMRLPVFEHVRSSGVHARLSDVKAMVKEQLSG